MKQFSLTLVQMASQIRDVPYHNNDPFRHKMQVFKCFTFLTNLNYHDGIYGSILFERFSAAKL